MCLFMAMFVDKDIQKKQKLYAGAESVLRVSALMLKQVQQLENSAYINVETAQEPVSRKGTQSSFSRLKFSEDRLSRGKRRYCFKHELILHQAQHESSHKSRGKKKNAAASIVII